MAQIQYIKDLFENEDLSLREISRRTNHSFNTVKKYAYQDNWGEGGLPNLEPESYPVLGEFIPIIDEWLGEGNGQCVTGMLLFVAAVVQHFTEVYLSPALRMSNGKITAAFSTHGELLLAHIALDAGIASGESVLVA